jgi:phosphatidate cytidylyltransferase
MGVLLLAAVIGPKALVFLVAVALTMSAAELFQGLRTRGYHPATLLGLVGTTSLVGAVYWKGLDAYPLVLALFVVFTLLWYLTGVVRARPAMNVAVTLLVFLYVGFLGSFAALILTAGRPGGRLLLGAIIATIAYDIGAFFVGSWAGKTPLAPDISPGKTVEGLVGASVATLLVCLVIVSNIDPWDGGKAFWLAIMVCVAAPLGDLCESMIKRDLDVKDMGNILPGHGGVLDRIDALLFVIPGTYYLARLVF